MAELTAVRIVLTHETCKACDNLHLYWDHIQKPGFMDDPVKKGELVGAVSATIGSTNMEENT